MGFSRYVFLLNNNRRIDPPVSPAAYHEISWCIVLRQSCRASDWWQMWVKQSHTHTHTTHDWEWRVYTTWCLVMTGGWLFDPHDIIWDQAPIWIEMRSWPIQRGGLIGGSSRKHTISSELGQWVVVCFFPGFGDCKFHGQGSFGSIPLVVNVLLRFLKDGFLFDSWR